MRANKKRKVKHESWNDRTQGSQNQNQLDESLEVNDEDNTTAVDRFEQNSFTQEETQNSTATDNPCKKQRKRKGATNGKILKRLKNVFSKGSNDKHASIDEECGKGKNHSTKVSASEPPANKQVEHPGTNKNRKKYPSRHQNASNLQKSTKKESRNKSGIFNAWKKSNESITFK